MPTGDATWKVEVITVPSSTGSVAYQPSGWGSRTPKALICYGTNWLTEDTAVTSNGCGLFRGMAAPKWDDASLIQNASAVIGTPAGNAHVTDTGHAIRMPDTSGTFSNYLYLASVTSLDAGGFTLNWGIAASGGYKVVVVALFGPVNVGSRIGLYDGTTFDLGFKAGASLLHGCWAGPATGLSDRTQEFYGGAAYPGGTDFAGWISAGACLHSFPTSASQQFTCELSSSPPHIKLVTGIHFIGPFSATDNVKAFPTGSPAAGNIFEMSGASSNGGMVTVWDDEDNDCFFQNPAASEDGTSTKSGLPFEPGLLLGYTNSDEYKGQSTGGGGGLGFMVVAPNFQWCATIDGFGAQGAYQSFSRGFCDVVNGTSVHAGTVELTDDGFVMTTVEDDVTEWPCVWHAFGHPDRFGWMPHIYRRLVA